jgi:hypothetical protein
MLFERVEKRERRNESIAEGMNLFKVHSMHVLNYHNEILSYY